MTLNLTLWYLDCGLIGALMAAQNKGLVPVLSVTVPLSIVWIMGGAFG